MLEAKSTKQTIWRSAWSYAALTTAAALSACVFFEPKGGGSTDPKNANAVALFKEQLPIPENGIWPAESGVDQSALGTLNSVFFDAAKSPLRYPGSRIKFNLFEGVDIYATVDKVKGMAGNHILSTGHVEGVEDGSFLISTYGGILNGVVRLPEAGNFNVSFTEGGKYRVSRLNDFDRPVTDVPGTDNGGVSVASLVEKGLALKKKNASVTVDVAVVYDSASEANTSDSVMLAKILASVDEANEVFTSSGVDLALRIVDTSKISGSTALADTVILARIKSTTDGFYNQIDTIRDESDADIVIFVVDTIATSGATKTLTKISTTGSDDAFIVVAKASLELGQYGIAQLVSKNMGCATDIKTGKKDKSYDTYSHGWTFKGKDKLSYRTVEAGGTGTRIPYLSTPLLTYQSKAIGAKTADNAKTLRITGPLFAAYKGTDAAAELEVTFPVDSSTFGGTNLKIMASVTDDNGKDTVVFLDSTGGTLTTLGSDTTAPFSLFATGLASGMHKIVVKVKDKGGNTTTSDTIHVTMGADNAPSGFTEQYLGKRGTNGTTTEDDDTLTMTSSGFGSTTNDDIQYIYKAMPANGRITATIHSVSSNSGLASAGLMIRDSLTNGGLAAFLRYGNDSLIKMTTRTVNGKVATTKSLTALKYTGVRTLKLVRRLNMVVAYQSNGQGWSILSPKTNFGAKGTVYAGIALASGDSLVTDTAVFSDVSSDTVGNYPPTLSVKGISDTTLSVGDSVTITATVADLDGAKAIKWVKVYEKGSFADTCMATDSTKPYVLGAKMKSGKSSVVVSVFDGTDTSSATYAIDGLGANDNVPVITSNSGGATATIHKAENDSVVTTVVATDADGDTPAFAKVGGADSAKFALNTATGVLNFKFKPQFDSAVDADSNNTYVVSVAASDGDWADTQTVTVRIHTTPVITSYDTLTTGVDTVTENTTAVETITSTNTDTHARVYVVYGGADASKFTINSASGALAFATAPDYENPTDANTDNNYVVLVRAADSVGSSVYDAVTITVHVKNDTDAVIDTLAAAKDAWGQGKDSVAIAHGASTSLIVKHGGTDTTNTFRSILTFSLANIDTATSAILRLYGVSSASTDTVQVIAKTFTDTSYTEGTVTYSSMPDSVFTTAADTVNVFSTTAQWYSFDVTTAVKAAVSANKTAFSFGLVGLDSTATRATFRSKEYTGTSTDPQLILTHLK